MELEELELYCKTCTKCKLYKTRNKNVFGAGNKQATIMFIGEGPGMQEDLSGIPFVGKSGQLFDKMLESVNLSRNEIYIANIVKCRPPKNRNPEPDEIEGCLDFLRMQVKIIKPKIIVCLGKVAAENIIHSNFKITKERGIWTHRGNFHLIATYHPSYLLRNPKKKKESWEDLKAIVDFVESVK